MLLVLEFIGLAGGGFQFMIIVWAVALLAEVIVYLVRCKKVKKDWYKNVVTLEEKQAKEKAFRERERQYKSIRTQERAKLLEEIEKAINEKIKYIPVNETTCVPMISIEELEAIFEEAKEKSSKIKKCTHS